MNKFYLFCLRRPVNKISVVFPLAYTIFLQVLTGFPKPNSLIEIDAGELFVRFSEKLFSYPFWLQDLSHLPLFFVLAWLWSWYLGSIKSYSDILKNRALYISISYGIFNELIQAFIPDRFPSPGDLIMNLIGVSLGLITHSLLFKRADKDNWE